MGIICYQPVLKEQRNVMGMAWADSQNGYGLNFIDLF